jgi:predicted DNA binding protein
MVHREHRAAARRTARKATEGASERSAAANQSSNNSSRKNCFGSSVRVGNDAQKKIELAAAYLPDLVRSARQIHQGEPQCVVQTAVLEAWSGLAAVEGWTPAMVRRVQREMRG